MRRLKRVLYAVISAVFFTMSVGLSTAAEDVRGNNVEQRLYQGSRSEYQMLRDMVESLKESLEAADKFINTGEFREYLLKSKSGGLDPIPVIYDRTAVVAVVADIFTPSAGARAGLRPSDVIRFVGGTAICGFPLGELNPDNQNDWPEIRELMLKCREDAVRALAAVAGANEFTIGILRDEKPLSIRINKSNVGAEADIAIAKRLGKWNKELGDIRRRFGPLQEQFKKLSPESDEKKIFALQDKVDALGRRQERIVKEIEKVRDALYVVEKEKPAAENRR